MPRRRVEFAADIGEMEIYCGFGTIQYMCNIPGAFSRRTPLYAFKFARSERNHGFDFGWLRHELHGCFADEVAEQRKRRHVV